MVAAAIGDMVLEYWIIGLICLQIVITIAQGKFLTDLLMNGVQELIEDMPTALATAFEENVSTPDFSDVSPVQMALAEGISQIFKNQGSEPLVNVSRADDGTFAKKLVEEIS